MQNKASLLTLAKVAQSILLLPKTERPYIWADKISSFDAIMKILSDAGYSIESPDFRGTDEEYAQFLKITIFVLEQN